MLGMVKRNETGQWGERLAEWFLVRRGYRIKERNLRIGRFQIDLVAELNSEVVFVEVKTRGAGSWISAAEALAPAQRRRLAAAALAYAGRLGGDPSVRFDVVSIDEGMTRLVIEHWRDALGHGGDLR